MNKIVTKYIIKSNGSNMKQDYLWYAMGSGLFALSTLLLTIVVSRTVGEQIGGMFSIGLSLAQIVMSIVNYEVRVYQVTDIKNEFSFGEYFTFRIMMCVLAYGAVIAYVVLNGYSILKLTVVLLLCIYKILESFADVFEGQFQKSNRIDIAGKSIFFRTLFSVVFMVLTLILTHSIIVALAVMVAVEIACLFMLNIMTISSFATMQIVSNIKPIARLACTCGPLALSSFIQTYIINCSKLAIDNTMSDEYQLYYSAVFMPNMVINLFTGIIFKPMQTSMAIAYTKGETKRFNKVVYKVIGIIVAFTILCCAGAYVLGIPVLSLLYAVELKPYKNVLLLLLLAGGINAINTILYYVLTIMRRQTMVAVVYLMVAGFSLLFVEEVTRAYGLVGAALSYIVLMAVTMLLLILCIGISKIKKKDNI